MNVSKVIKSLQEMQNVYGDLPLTISVDFKKSSLSKEENQVISAECLFFGYDQFSEKQNEINIRSFPY